MSAGEESAKSARMQVDCCLLTVLKAAGFFLLKACCGNAASSCGRPSSKLVAFCMAAQCCR